MTAAVTTQGVRIPGALFLFAVLLSGCATMPDTARLAEGRQISVVLDHVPFHAQRDYQCGPASLAMALNASGVPATVDELIPQVYLPAREGSLQPEMLATTRRHDRIAFVLDGTLDGLLTEVERGHPVLVLQNLSLPAWPMWHYAVVIGYDLERNRMVLHTDEREAARIGLRRFDNTWARSDRWAMVALPVGEIPIATDPVTAAEDIAAFERVAAPGTAVPAWQAHTARWPDRALGWFALGNSLYAGDDLDGAAAAFTEATNRDAGYGPAWLNLGFIHEERGALAEARAALERAAELDGPWREVAARALSRLGDG